MDVVAERLRAAESLLVVTHARPDGDGLGAMVALAGAARAVGRTAGMLVPGSIPERYEFLFAIGDPAPARQFEDLAAAADAVVIVDTCAFAQLDGLAEALRNHHDKVVVIDHHETRDAALSDAAWTDTSAAATGVMVAELLAALGWPVDRAAADALAAAILSDTGWMRFSNTDARACRTLAGLIEQGVRVDQLYKGLYQSDRMERMKLLIRMLESLELHCDGRLAIMAIRRDDFRQTGARPDETENLINEALRLETVEIVLLLVENTQHVRVSLRSRDHVDVAEIAQSFGGGGHARAAGIRLDQDIDDLKSRLIAACEESLRRAGLLR